MNTRKHLSLAALAVMALTGCTMMPAYERPAAPVPAQWSDAAASAGDRAVANSTKAASAADLKWQDFFADASLRHLIERALRGNRDLRMAVLSIEQARAQYDIRSADSLPTVGLGATGSRAPTASGGTTKSYAAGLSVTAWEIDFFGRIASLSEVALAQFLATEEGRKAAQISLIGAVANAWLNLVAGDELLALTQQTLATREESQRLVRLRFDNGATSELDWRQAQSLTEAARVALVQQQRQRALDLNALSLLVGEPIGRDFKPAVTTASVALPDLPAGTPSQVLVQRPDVRAAEQQLIAANANIGAARAAFFPRITLTAGLGTVSNELSGLFSGGSWGLTVAPQLLLPIFDAGRNQAGLRSASVARDIALAQYEKAIQAAFREVADALTGRASLGAQLRAQGDLVQAETQRLRLADLRYQNGVSSYLDLLDAQRSLFAAQQALIQTRQAQLQNQVQLYRVLGGGWSGTGS